MIYPTALGPIYLATLLTGIFAHPPEQIDGFTNIWLEDFSGSGSINLNNWDYYLGTGSNNEQQTYLANSPNCQLSGQGSLIIQPTNNNGQWTSCRIESLPSFQANAGGQMIIQSRFRLGTPRANLQGIWPAFWSLGQSVREGTQWPQCGEIDTFENINGGQLGFGTLHCGSTCNGGDGLSQGIDFNYGDFHTWGHAIDLREADWHQQSITWYMDGQPYHVIHGSDLGNQDDWAATAQSPMFMTLNVAVGGDWPGPATASTASGEDSGMEILYVAVYQSD